MRTQFIVRLVRRLPPKIQIGLGVLAVAVLGVMWLTGSLPFDGTGEYANRETRTVTGAAPARQQRREATQATSGQYKYLSLSLSWSPTYCETEGRGRKDQQCNGQRPYAFVLHGLWPQHEKGWPENCSTGTKPWIPKETIRSMLDIMPSRGLIIHQYRKHGTCTGLSPKAYFSLSRRLYGKIRIPPRYIRPRKVIHTSPREIENDFLQANPGMNASMISVVCGRRKRLKEIRICFSKDGLLTSCGRNEEQRRLCSSGKIRMPPVRGRRRS